MQRAGSKAARRGISAIWNRDSKGLTPSVGRGQTRQGRKRGGIPSGRSRAWSGRGGKGNYQEERGKGVEAGRGRGRGPLRERGVSLLRRGHGGIIQRGSISQQQLVAHQVRIFNFI